MRDDSRRYAIGAMLAAVLAGSAPGFPQVADDLETAIQLARDGKTQLAEEAVKKAFVSTADANAATQIVQAEALQSRAESQTDLDTALALLEEGAGRLQTALRAESSQSLALRARRGLDLCIHRKALRAGEAALQASASGNAARRDDAIRKASSLYDAALLNYQVRARQLRGKADADEQELADVLLDGARAALESARLEGSESGSGSGRQVLKDWIGVLEDLEYGQSDHSAAFEALWIEGLCHLELGDLVEAEDCLRGAASLGPRLGAGKKEPTSYQLGILRGSAVSLADCLIRAGKAKEASEHVDRVLAGDAALAMEPAADSLRLYQAEALFQLGDTAKAQAIATSILQEDPDGRSGAAAREKLRKWAIEAKSIGVVTTPEQLLTRASSDVVNESWPEAIRTLRMALDRCRGEATRSQELEAWFVLGQCHARTGRNLEAAFAFEMVYSRFPDHALAPRACYEAVRALSAEASATGDRADGEAQEALLKKLLEKWPDHEVARNVQFLQAEAAERAGNDEEAAAAFLAVPADAEAHETALVSAARCLFRQASRLWEKRETDPAAAAAARKMLGESSRAVDRFLELLREPARAPKTTAASQQRANLAFLAVQQQVLIDSHEAVGRNEEAIRRIDEEAALLKDGERVARLISLKVRPLIALSRPEEAVKTVETLLESHAGSASIPAACKTLSAHFDESLENEVKTKGAKEAEDPAAAAKVEQVLRYTTLWIQSAIAKGKPPGGVDALGAAQTLYRNAGRRNGHWSTVVPFLLAPEPPREPRPFDEAARVFRALVEGKLGGLDERGKLEAEVGLARCEAQTARDAVALEAVRKRYQAIVQSRGLIGANGKVDANVLASQPGLFISICLELATVHEQLGVRGNAPSFETSFAILQEVAGQTRSGSDGWWLSKYLMVRTLASRAGAADVKSARILLANLESTYPELDKDEFGMKTLFAQLEPRLSGAGRPK